MRTTRVIIAGLVGVMSLSGSLAAQRDTTSRPMTAEEFERSLHYKTGTVTLPGDIATLVLPEGYRFLNGSETERVLTAWGNPPGSGALGMIVPPGKGVTADSIWSVIVTFRQDGYVKDDEASKIDYDAMLQQMQKDAVAEDEDREKEGYPTVRIIGWADEPRYDQASHKLYWAKEIKFGDRSNHTLNYAIRVLGRRGVLQLNAVASMDKLDTVKEGMQAVMGFVNFNQGHRYSDFLPGTDKVAAYGVGALILGTVAAKAGLFKVILAGLLAAKKLILVGFAGAAAFFRRVFAKKKPEAAAAPPAG